MNAKFRVGNTTISDLKTGLVVEYANGERALVVKNRLLSVDGYNSLETSYNEDLTCLNPRYTINRIYALNLNEVYKLEDFLSLNSLELLWERKGATSHVKKMTKAEIEAQLGYEIEIVEEEK